MDLFGRQPVAQPLAARLRATSLDEYVGQEHVLAPGKPLRGRWSRALCTR